MSEFWWFMAGLIVGFAVTLSAVLWQDRMERKRRGSHPLQVPIVGFDSTSEPKHCVCGDCGCWIEAGKALPVVYGDYWDSQAARNAEHFCRRCKPPYDRWFWEATPDGSDSVETFYKRVPEHEIRVNKDGSEWKEGGDAK